MSTILELQPPKFSDITEKFTSINLSFPTPSFVFPTDLLTAKFDALTGVVDSFSGLVQNLPKNPEDLLGDLLGELKSLGSSSVEVENLLNGLTKPFINANGVFAEFQTVFTPLSTELFPTLLRLQEQPVDSSSLVQLFAVDKFADFVTSQIPLVLEPQLKQMADVRSHLGWLQQPVFSDYQQTLEAIASLQLDASLSSTQLAALNEQKFQQFQTSVSTLQQNAQTATEDLQKFQGSLAGVSPALNTALDKTLDKFTPEKLAAAGNPFKNILNLGDLNLGSAVTKIQTVIQPLEKLVDQGVEKATAGINQVVGTVEKAIATADQALIKVSALITNVVEQLIGFIQKVDLTSLINQAKDIFQGLMLKLNGVLNQVGVVIEKVYTFVRSMVDQVKTLGDKLPPLAEEFRQLLAKITSFLDNPQVRNAVQQAKQGIDIVVQKLDEVSLEPVFDQVLIQVDKVKASLQAIDLSQLNQMLKSVLSAALNLVRGAIDPPAKVTDVVKEQYNTLIDDPIIGGIVQPVKLQIDGVVDLIHQLEPGTLVGGVLTPLYEQALASVKKFVDPDQIATLLQPLTDFQTNLLKQIDQVINPQKLLAPLVDFYGQIVSFVRSLDATTLLAPLNDLLQQATQPLESLGLESLVNNITTSVSSVTNLISNFQIDERLFDLKMEPLIEKWQQQLRNVVNQMDLSGLQTILQPLRTAATTILEQTRWEGTARLALVQQIQDMVADVINYTAEYSEQMSVLVKNWKIQRDRLEGFTPAPEIASEFNALQRRLQSLNPISLLATATKLIDQLADTANGIFESIKQIWQKLGDRLNQQRQYLDQLVNNEAQGLKTYLNQVINSLVDGVLKKVTQSLDKPLIQMKGVLQSIRKLQGALKTFDLIPQSIQKIGNAIIAVKDKIRAFNFNFLAEPLGRVINEIQKPLEALNPEPILIVPLTQVYNKVLKMLQNLNPVNIFATARGTITFKAESSNAPITISLGTQLAAKTPLGEEIWYETLLEGTIGISEQIDIPIQAIVPGRASDIVAVTGVTWRVVDHPELQATHSQEILSLTTLVQEQLLGMLTVFNPVKLIAEPLNEQYQKIVQLFDDLGIAKLFDTFFQKIESIDQEIAAGLDRLGGAFGGLLSAMPNS